MRVITFIFGKFSWFSWKCPTANPTGEDVSIIMLHERYYMILDAFFLEACLSGWAASFVATAKKVLNSRYILLYFCSACKYCLECKGDLFKLYTNGLYQIFPTHGVGKCVIRNPIQFDNISSVRILWGCQNQTWKGRTL